MRLEKKVAAAVRRVHRGPILHFRGSDNTRAPIATSEHMQLSHERSCRGKKVPNTSKMQEGTSHPPLVIPARSSLPALAIATSAETVGGGRWAVFQCWTIGDPGEHGF
jgi:hypothetical protein